MTTPRRTVAEQIGHDFIAGLTELVATAKSGGLDAVLAKHGLPGPSSTPSKVVRPQAHKKSPVRTNPGTVSQLPTISKKDIRHVCKSLGLTLPQLAGFIGKPVKTVQAWADGVKTPSPPERRLIGEMRDNPEYWQQRVMQKT